MELNNVQLQINKKTPKDVLIREINAFINKSPIHPVLKNVIEFYSGSIINFCVERKYQLLNPNYFFFGKITPTLKSMSYGSLYYDIAIAQDLRGKKHIIVQRGYSSVSEMSTRLGQNTLYNIYEACVGRVKSYEFIMRLKKEIINFCDLVNNVNNQRIYKEINKSKNVVVLTKIKKMSFDETKFVLTIKKQQKYIDLNNFQITSDTDNTTQDRGLNDSLKRIIELQQRQYYDDYDKILPELQEIHDNVLQKLVQYANETFNGIKKFMIN